MYTLEGFRKYVHRGRANTPKVTIRKAGQIGFNSGAIGKYNLDVYKYAMLFISEDKKRVAVKFTNNENESGRLAIQKRPGSFAFSAIPFMRLHDISYDETRNFDFTWIEKDKVAIFRPTED